MTDVIAQHRLLTRIIAPAVEPLSLTETKHYLRVEQTDDDTLITDLIVSVRMAAESWLRRSLINQSWKLGYDESLPNRVGLPMGPVTGIDNVTIISRDGSSNVISSSTYYLNNAKTSLHFDMSLSGFHIDITYNTGYGAVASDVPEAIRQGVFAGGHPA